LKPFSKVKVSSQTSSHQTFPKVNQSPSQWTCSIDFVPKTTFFKIAPFSKKKIELALPPSTLVGYKFLFSSFKSDLFTAI
jgi:hypothetical protein